MNSFCSSLLFFTFIFFNLLIYGATTEEGANVKFCESTTLLKTELQRQKCKEIVVLSDKNHIWTIDGSSLVIDNVALVVPFSMGNVKWNFDKAHLSVSGRYSLVNDIDFELKPSDADLQRWKVKLNGQTHVSGSPDNHSLEAIIHHYFLQQGTTLTIRSQVSLNEVRLIMESENKNKKNSIQLFNRPSFNSKLNTMTDFVGIWEDRKRSVRFAIHPRGIHSLACDVRGANEHTFFIEQRTSTSSIKVGNVKSTSLDSKEGNKFETELVSSIAQSTKMEIIKKNSDWVLNFFAPKKNESLSFYKISNSTIFHPYSASTSTFWQWMPETLTYINEKTNMLSLYGDYLKPYLNSTVIAEVRESLISKVVDIHVNGVPSIRLTRLETGAVKPQQHVATINNSEKKKFFLGLITSFFEQVVSIEIDRQKNYLNFPGSSSSSSFKRIPVPSPGTWVLDKHFGLAHEMGGDDSGDDYATLDLEFQNGDLSAVISGTSSALVTFTLMNKKIRYGTHDWNVTRPASRSGVSKTDGMLKEFFVENTSSCLLMKGKNGFESLLFSSGNRQLLFVRPNSLTAALVGDWKLLSLSKDGAATNVESIFLILKSAGVGQVSGVAQIGDRHYHVKMKESVNKTSAQNNNTPTVKVAIPKTPVDLMPLLWDIVIKEDKAGGHDHSSHHHHHHHSATAAAHEHSGNLTRPGDLTPQNSAQAKAYSSIIQAFEKFNSVSISRLGMEIQITGPGISSRFIKVLDHQSRHTLPGKWDLQFFRKFVPSNSNNLDELFFENRPLHLNILPSMMGPYNNSNSEDIAWSYVGLSKYSVTADISSEKNSSTTARWDMIVNPNKEIRIENVKWTGDSKQLKLIDQLKEFLESTDKKLLEVSGYQMLIGDKDSILALSRRPEHTAEVMSLFRHTDLHTHEASKIMPNHMLAPTDANIMELIRHKEQK